MKWAHLPEAGGLYDQDPELLDAFRYIFGKKSEYDEEQSRNSTRASATKSRTR